MLEFIADRPALCHDRECTVDLLVRILAPRPQQKTERPGINLALVLDRSGSMQGEKIELTRRAAALTVKALTARDRLSVVSFANDVSTVVASTSVTDKERILRQIENIQAYGSTALFDGWKCGAAQASLELSERRLNRVVLLTDGQANVGETNPDAICHDVNRLSQRGLQTTTLGFGKDYNEILLRSMAASGGGNHFFVETPDQLTRFIELELEGLAATIGTRVRLKLVSHIPGLQVEPLSEVQTQAEGSYELADLTLEVPLELLFRVKVPAGSEPDSGLTAELSWHSPESGQSECLQVTLALPRVSAEERLRLPINPQVEGQLAVAMAARARKEAIEAMRRGDRAQATRLLGDALGSGKLPDLERSQLQQLRSSIQEGDASKSSKLFESQSYAYSRGSVVLGAIEEQLLLGWMDAGLVPLRNAPFLRNGPQGVPTAGRVEGMLRGFFRGAGDSEPARLGLATLQAVNGSNRFLPWIGSFFKTLSAIKVENPSQCFAIFRERVDQGESFLSSGANLPDAGAMARLAPLLLGRLRNPTASHWVFIVVGCHITHNDAASAASCLAFGNMLWNLMQLSVAPSSHYYLDTFLAVMDQVEKEQLYPSPAPRHDGWTGKLSDYLRHVIPDARRRGLSLEEVRQEWGSGAHLFETVPALLYLLECHGHQPHVALRQAQSCNWLGALAGAALGALHGNQTEWPLQGEYATAFQEFLAQQ